MSSLEFVALPEVDYYVVVDCVSGRESSFAIDVSCAPPSGAPAG